MRIFPESVSKFWSLWEIRVAVPLSLILQTILILTGKRRKYSASNWLRRLLWLAYLSADWVATVALSVLSSNSTDNNGINYTDTDNIITAFWAPFLLLHLGGPDTITAYSMEDNELWWRHLLVLLVQVGLAISVFLRAWDGRVLNFLSIPMFIAGIIKFGERTWVLRSASTQQYRESMLPRPDPGPNYARFMDEFCFKKDEGFEVELGTVLEAPALGDYSFTAPNVFPKAANLQHAYVFFKTFKCLFADLILSIHDILNSRSFFKNRSCEEAFKVIEIELGFMYDLFYTKADLVYSVPGPGVILRVISFTCIISVFMAFLIIEKQNYSVASVIISYALLGGAIILEVYAVILLLCSDWTMLWLSKHKKARDLLYPVISSIPLAENKRWSNVISQYNLIRYCCEDKPAQYSFLQKVPWIFKKFKKSLYKDSEVVTDKLKELIFQQLIKKSWSVTEFKFWKNFCTHRGNWVLENEKCLDKLHWSIEEEFDQSILLWHIATDLCYFSDQEKNSNSFCDPNWEASKLLSEYMLYLLVMRPFMLPNGIGQIRFQDTWAEAKEFFEQRKCKGDQRLACMALLEVSTKISPAKVKGDRSKSVLFDACRLAEDLQSLETERNWENQKKWELISHVWVEMLSYAASQCQCNHHAQQLRRGGELLTHVWLLMAHLGMTEQFQISEGYARARLIVQ